MKAQKIISLVITLTVISLLLFSGPAGAITMSFSSNLSTNQSSPTSRVQTTQPTLTFNITYTLENSDKYVPVSNFSLVIKDTQDFQERECVFDKSGTILSDCGGIRISKKSSPSNYSSGVGYGYGYVPGSGYQNVSWAAGYGYGLSGSSDSWVFEITLQTDRFSSGIHGIAPLLTAARSGTSADFSLQSTKGYFEINASQAQFTPTYNATDNTTLLNLSEDPNDTTSPLFNISLTGNVSNANVTISKSATMNTSNFALSTITPSGKTGTIEAITYLNITLDTNVGNEDDQEATIYFGINASLLPAGLDPDDVSLYRLHNNAWTELTTTYLGQSGNVYRYSAVTPGFSVFLIGQSTSSLTNSGNGGGGSSSSDYTAGGGEFDLTAQGTILIAEEDETYWFIYDEENHSISFDYIGLDSVKLTISSDPITDTLYFAQPRYYNLDDDNFYDIYTALRSISGNKARIFVQKVFAAETTAGPKITGVTVGESEEVPEEKVQEPGVEVEVTDKEKSPAAESAPGEEDKVPSVPEEETKNGLVWAAVIVAILLIIVLLSHRKKKRRKAHHKTKHKK